MKNILLFIVSQFLFLSAIAQNKNSIVDRIHRENKNLMIPDSSGFFTNGYMHLEGKIGHADASIELNVFPGKFSFKAYLFCDSLQGLYGFVGTYSKGLIHFYYEDYNCVGSVHTIYEMYLAIKKDSGLTGYVITDTNNTAIKCSFREVYTPNKLLFRNLNFSYSSTVNKFPVDLYGNLLFADTITKAGKKLNEHLLTWCDQLGQNSDEIEKISFKDLEYLKTRKAYKTYCINKFKRICQKTITKEFIADAKESGHNDVYLNGLNVEVLVNDGRYIVLQLISGFADGIAYPYCQTSILEYDVEQMKVLDIAYQFKEAMQTEADLNDNAIAIIAKLKQAKLYDASNEGLSDGWFLSNLKIAFITQKGYVLTRSGGNHGIHQFYKFYSKGFIKPFLKIH